MIFIYIYIKQDLSWENTKFSISYNFTTQKTFLSINFFEGKKQELLEKYQC